MKNILADNPRIELAEAVQHMEKSKHHPNCIGVQFVQIGNADGAEEALTDLIYGKNGVSFVIKWSWRVNKS